MKQYLIEWHHGKTNGGGASQSIEAAGDTDAKNLAEEMYRGFKERGWTYILRDSRGKQV